MSDIETIEAILKRCEIAYERDKADRTADARAQGSVEALRVEDGYSGFFTVFDFGPEGNLLRVSAWE